MEQTIHGIHPAGVAGQSRGVAQRVGRRRRAWLYGAGTLALIGVVIAAIGAARAVAYGEALRDAERATARLADEVRPLLASAQHGDPIRLAALDQTIENRKKTESLMHVTIWDVDGRVIYADEADQIGRRLVAPTEVGQAITQGTVSSDFEVQPEAANVVYDPAGPGFVEVYVPLQLPDRPRLAFEAYYDYPVTEQVAAELFRRILPVVLSLALLLILQLPAAALGRRLRQHRADRRVISRSSGSGVGPELERSKVATDAYGAAIQDIAGVGYALGAVGLWVPELGQPLMQEAQLTVQRALGSLRQLTTDLHPLQLTAEGLPDAIMTLTAPLRHQGIDVHTRFEALPALPELIAFTLYEAAHEVLASVAVDAGVSRVDIDLAVHHAPSDPLILVMKVTDNGVGGPAARIPRAPDQHHTLKRLEQFLLGMGGSLTLTTGPIHGTTSRIELPVDAGWQL